MRKPARSLADFPGVGLHGTDLSEDVLKWVPPEVRTAQGSLLNLPYEDAQFDLAFAVESLEHVVHVEGALREFSRVLRPGGTLLIIDKDQRRLGSRPLPEWEQWFDTRALAKALELKGFTVRTVENVGYDGVADGLFTGWLGQKPIPTTSP